MFIGRTPVYNKSDNWPQYHRNEPQYYIWNGNIRGRASINKHWFESIFSGTGEGPRATACAFWNEFIPILRKENRTVTIKFESRKDDMKLNHFFGSASIQIRLDRIVAVLHFLLFLVFGGK